MSEIPPPLSKAQIDSFHKTLSNWGRFGERDQLGTLNLISASKRRAAAGLAQSGRTVSCARMLPTQPAEDNPRPVTHAMISTGSDGMGVDYFAIAPHGMATSHIDALCHIFDQDKLYNGYLEPGDPIFVADLERAEGAASLQVEPGDILLVRTGRWKLRDERGPWNAGERIAGLDASCLPWLHERGVAALGCDGISDVLPSRIEGVPLPIHTVTIPVMGLHLIDNLDLEGLGDACAEENRWQFLLTITPLVLFRGTASPVNPIALF